MNTTNPSPDSLTFKRTWAEAANVPISCLADLAGDESYEIRMLVADHPLTPIAILELLAEDDHPDVRYSMAENANTPAHILKILLHDENPYVAHRAQKTLSRLAMEPRANMQWVA